MRALPCCVVVCAACSLHNAQSALDASGPQATRVLPLWWTLLAIAVVVCLLVVVVLVWGAARRRDHAGEGENHRRVIRPDAITERRLARTVAIALATTIVILFAVLLFDFRVGRALAMAPNANAVRIRIVGHQWWWEVHYPDSATTSATTANEVHIPIGRPVLITLESRDVIHSIWVPSLAGKQDVLPGYSRSLWFRADTPGVYRGQCAEFCGHEHAKMGMLVIAEPEASYDAWLTAQRAPAAEPADSLASRGRTVFLGSPCPLCHAINGTGARATAGPDLTHLASRRTIAAGSLDNTTGNLIAWISDPQAIKPWTIMPATRLDARDMQALVAYLRGLK